MRAALNSRTGGAQGASLRPFSALRILGNLVQAQRDLRSLAPGYLLPAPLALIHRMRQVHNHPAILPLPTAIQPPPIVIQYIPTAIHAMPMVIHGLSIPSPGRPPSIPRLPTAVSRFPIVIPRCGITIFLLRIAIYRDKMRVAEPEVSVLSSICSPRLVCCACGNRDRHARDTALPQPAS